MVTAAQGWSNVLIVARYFILIAATFVAVCHSANALSCLPCSVEGRIESHIANAYCDADVVLVARVEASFELPDGVTEYKLWPEKVHKGRVSSPVYTLSGRDSCRRFEFARNVRYLIFGSRYQETQYLVPMTCSLTSVLRDAELHLSVIADLEKRGKPCSKEAFNRRRSADFLEKERDLERLRQESLAPLEDQAAK